MKKFWSFLLFLTAAIGVPSICQAVYPGPVFYPLYSIQTLYASTSVGSTYVQLLASSSQKINGIQVADSGGQAMLLGFGVDCSHVTSTLLIPKNFTGNLIFPVGFPKTTAICLKSTGTTVSSGENDLNVFY